jgi:hypothetical protein
MMSFHPDWPKNDTHPTVIESCLRNPKQHNGVTVVRKYHVLDHYLWV